MQKSKRTPIRVRLYLQRVLLGLLLLLASIGWFLALRAGRHLDAYWRQVHWMQRLLAAGGQEREIQQQLHHTLAGLFDALESCECRSDPARARELWLRFTSLLDQETQRAARTRELLQEYERAAGPKGDSP